MREFFRDDRMYSQRLYFDGKSKKSYGFFSFMFDVIMTAFTSGLWLIWVFVREMRGRR
jgi:hypothetical protein